MKVVLDRVESGHELGYLYRVLFIQISGRLVCEYQRGSLARALAIATRCALHPRVVLENCSVSSVNPTLD